MPATKLYWAYGSNLNKRQMLMRCPAAIPLEPLTMQNLILRFRGVADVAYRTGAYCEGALWAITPACEEELDIYEGVGSTGYGLYRKCYFDYTDPDTETTHRVLYYKMNRHGIMPPSEGYLDCIVEGYADFGIDPTRLVKAVEHSWRKKDLSGFMGHRWHKAGKPRMGRPERIAVLYGEADEEDEESTVDNMTALRNDLADDELPTETKKTRAEWKKDIAAFWTKYDKPKKPVEAPDVCEPDVCLRIDPEDKNHCRAVTITGKGEAYFAEHINVAKQDSEWLFKFSTYTIAGLLQKKGLRVAILEKLKK